MVICEVRNVQVFKCSNINKFFSKINFIAGYTSEFFFFFIYTSLSALKNILWLINSNAS